MISNSVFRTVLLAASFSLVAATGALAADPPAPAATNTPASAPAEAPAAATPATSAEKPAAPAANAPVAAKEQSPEAKTEADAAAQLEKKFQDAARSYRQVQKNGQTMYCKKEKPIGSTIPQLQCITESQLRLQVEQMDELRNRMRNSSKCTMGPGCSGGS